MGKTRSVSALCAFFVVSLVLAACGGGGIPGDAVVKVGDSTIKKSTFQHWLQIAAISSQGQTNPSVNGAPAKANIPVPPDFTACIANKKKTAPKPAKGQPTPTDAQIKTQCQTEYQGLRDQVLQFLISAEWISGEAADQNIKVTDKEVQAQFQKTRKQSFPKDADFQKFLKSSGMMLNDLLFRVRLDTLSNKLRTKITKGKDTVTPAQIQAYYKKNLQRFAQPERRDLRIILTKTKGAAQRALGQVRSGTAFSKVAKALSIDQASKSQGGVLLAVAKGQQEKALDDAVFSAAKGKLTGPVKTQFGYYVFKVQRIAKATQQSVKEATPTIKQLLGSQNQQSALDAFVKNFRKKWKSRTECRDGYVTQDCKNAPKPKAPATGAVAPTTAPAGSAPPTTAPPATTAPPTTTTAP